MGFELDENGRIRGISESTARITDFPVEFRSRHGAAITQRVVEYEVEMVSDDPIGPFGEQITLADAIPVGAFDVWLTGRVLETVVSDPDLNDRILIAGKDAASSGSTDWTGAYGYFGYLVSPVAGTVWGPGCVWAPTWQQGYDPTVYGGSSFNTGRRLWWPGGGDVWFTNENGGAFVSGRVRIAIFYSLITPPEE